MTLATSAAIAAPPKSAGHRAGRHLDQTSPATPGLSPAQRNCRSTISGCPAPYFYEKSLVPGSNLIKLYGFERRLVRRGRRSRSMSWVTSGRGGVTMHKSPRWRSGQRTQETGVGFCRQETPRIQGRYQVRQEDKQAFALRRLTAAPSHCHSWARRPCRFRAS